MKKIISSVLFISLLLTLVFAMCACSGANTNTQNNSQQNNSQQNNSEQSNPNETPQPPKSAYEELSEDEKLIFDAFVVNMNDFSSPESVRVLNVHEGSNTEWSASTNTIPKSVEGLLVLLRLKYQTEQGGNTQDYFLLCLTEGGFYAYSKMWQPVGAQILAQNPTLDYISISRLNKALVEYCEGMGY